MPLFFLFGKVLFRMILRTVKVLLKFTFALLFFLFARPFFIILGVS